MWREPIWWPGLSETRRRSVIRLARTRSSSWAGNSAFRVTSPSILSASRHVEDSPSEIRTMCSRLALVRRWLPRNSTSSEIWADVRLVVPSGSMDVVRWARPALSAGSDNAPDRTTSPKATVGSPRFSTCRMFRPLSSLARFGIGGVNAGCGAASGVVLRSTGDATVVRCFSGWIARRTLASANIPAARAMSSSVTPTYRSMSWLMKPASPAMML